MLTAVGRGSIRRLGGGGASSLVFLPRRLVSLGTSRVTASVESQARGLMISARLAQATKSAGTSTETKSGEAAKKKPAAKEPAAKKKSAATKKSDATQKPAKAGRKTAKKAEKPKPKGRQKKPASPEVLAKAEKKELKAKALLGEPRRLPVHPYQLFMSKTLTGTSPKDHSEAAVALKGAAEAWKSISEEEFQALEIQAEKNKLTNQAAYKAWVESYSTAEVVAANTARFRLARKYQIEHPKIKDPRIPKRPVTPYILFVKARHASGEHTEKAGTDRTKAIAAEWNKMSESEKQPYKLSAAPDAERYLAAKKSLQG